MLHCINCLNFKTRNISHRNKQEILDFVLPNNHLKVLKAYKQKRAIFYCILGLTKSTVYVENASNVINNMEIEKCFAFSGEEK